MIDFRLPFNDLRVHLIGDPHLGYDFDKHAPSHRKGQRATHQMARFYEELNHDAEFIVMVGDLFEDPGVPQRVVVAAASAVLSAAENKPDTRFLMMAGNHDVPRNLTRIGAWTTFTKMVEDRLPNLIVTRRPMFVEGLGLFPWEWDRTAAEQVADIAHEPVEAAIGHWDLELFDGDGSHMAPVKELREAFGDDVILRSGHFHKPGVYGDVICTGSMQPMNHGEDPDEILYVTRTLSEVLAQPELYRDKHVRLLVKPGEEIPSIDALAVTHLRVREDVEVRQSVVGDYDWTKRLSERIATLDPDVQDFIIERLPDADPRKQRDSSTGPRLEGSGVEHSGVDEMQQGSA